MARHAHHLNIKDADSVCQQGRRTLGGILARVAAGGGKPAECKEVEGCEPAHAPSHNHLVAVHGLNEEYVSGGVGQLNAIRRHRLGNSIWAYERRCDEVEAGIQVFLCRQITLRSSELFLHRGPQKEQLLAPSL